MLCDQILTFKYLNQEVCVTMCSELDSSIQELHQDSLQAGDEDGVDLHGGGDVHGGGVGVITALALKHY